MSTEAHSMDDRELTEGKDFSETSPFDGEVFEYRFEKCNFSDSDLGDVSFVDCLFDKCNLSMADVEGAKLGDVHFHDCKLLGVDFSRCGDFGFSVRFEDCNLSFCSFYQKQMEKTEFVNCLLREVNFTETDLSQASFRDSDLSGATFARTILEFADLRGARHFAIDPEANRIQGARVSRGGLEGLLLKYELEID